MQSDIIYAPHRCPRRDESVHGMAENKPTPDTWKEKPNGDHTCSFCGSLHPNEVVRLIEKFGLNILEPSDKWYKWYVTQPNVSNAAEGGIKYYRQHDNDLLELEIRRRIKGEPS